MCCTLSPGILRVILFAVCINTLAEWKSFLFKQQNKQRYKEDDRGEKREERGKRGEGNGEVNVRVGCIHFIEHGVEELQHRIERHVVYHLLGTLHDRKIQKINESIKREEEVI